jgi:hypothetical protein
MKVSLPPSARPNRSWWLKNSPKRSAMAAYCPDFPTEYSLLQQF